MENRKSGIQPLKRGHVDIDHECSLYKKAQKNHYLLKQISDFMKQLYEYFYLKKNEIKKAKKISSELLVKFGRLLMEQKIY